MAVADNRPPVQVQPRPRIPAWPALLSYLCAFVLVVLGDSVLWELLRFATSAGHVVAVAATNGALLLLVALVAARLQGDVRSRLRIGPSRASAAGVVAASVGTVGLSIAGGALSELLGVGHEGVQEMVETALRGADPAMFAAALGAIALAPGIGEETFFRGLRQTRRVASLGRWPAIGIASLAFGLLHLDKVQTPLVFVIGLFLGWCAERLDGIRPTIVAHATNNAVFILLATVGSRASAQRGVQVAAGASGVLVCLLCAAVLRTGVAIKGRAS
jgi:membrane protease YdiL (CAAX protease family)